MFNTFIPIYHLCGQYILYSMFLHKHCHTVLVLSSTSIQAWPTTYQRWSRALSCLFTEWRPCWCSTIARKRFGWGTWRTATWRLAVYQLYYLAFWVIRSLQGSFLHFAGRRDSVSEVTRKWLWRRGGAMFITSSGTIRWWGTFLWLFIVCICHIWNEKN